MDDGLPGECYSRVTIRRCGPRHSPDRVLLRSAALLTVAIRFLEPLLSGLTKLDGMGNTYGDLADKITLDPEISIAFTPK